MKRDNSAENSQKSQFNPLFLTTIKNYVDEQIDLDFLRKN